MKKLFVLFVIALLALPAAVFAQEEESDDETRRFEVGQAHVALQTARIETGMDTAIAYIKELGGDTTALETLKTDFSALADQVVTFTSRAGLKEGAAQMRDKVKEFRELSADLVEANGGSVDELKTRITTAHEESTDVDEAKSALATTVSDWLLGKFDRHYENLQRLYTRAEERFGESNPEEVAELKTILDDFAALRTELETAVNAADVEKVRDVHKEAKALNDAYRTAVQALAGELGESPRHRMNAVRGSVILSRMSATINDLGTLGYDVSGLDTLNDAAEADFNAAKDAIAAGDREAARESLTTFKADVKAFIDAVRELVGAEDRDAGEVEAEVDAIEEAVEAVGVEA